MTDLKSSTALAGPAANVQDVTLKELVELCAIDNRLYSRTFFPNTARQPTPDFHDDVWALLESKHRKVNLQMFRGSAKTSLFRLYMSKRVAYGLARTVLILGKSEAHAVRTGAWLKSHIERPKLYAETFQLEKGGKWQDVEFEIRHGLEDRPIWFMCMGMTGSVRGVNRDDYRPDLILLDDPLDEENTATAEQRLKVNNLIYGAVARSLASVEESPDAKVVMAQTPLNKEDASVMALKDPSWKSARFGCWTKETENLPNQDQISAWPEMHSTAELRKEKQGYIRRNQLSVWMREMEVRVTAPELNAFRPDMLNFYGILPEQNARVMVIDPVPPPTDNQVSKGMQNNDYEVLSVVQRTGTDIYMVDYKLNRGHTPDWTIKTFFELMAMWRPHIALVEAVAYQSTLKWLLEKEMQNKRLWFPVLAFGRDDKRKKYTKIIDSLTGLGAQGKLHVKAHHTDLISQFNDYPNVTHEDVLETFAIGASYLLHGLSADDEEAANSVEEVDDLDDIRQAMLGAP